MAVDSCEVNAVGTSVIVSLNKNGPMPKCSQYIRHRSEVMMSNESFDMRHFQRNNTLMWSHLQLIVLSSCDLTDQMWGEHWDLGHLSWIYQRTL